MSSAAPCATGPRISSVAGLNVSNVLPGLRRHPFAVDQKLARLANQLQGLLSEALGEACCAPAPLVGRFDTEMDMAGS